MIRGVYIIGQCQLFLFFYLFIFSQDCILHCKDRKALLSHCTPVSVAQCGEGVILSYKGTRSPQCEVGTSGGQNAGSRAVRSHRDTITAPRKMTIIQNDTLKVHTGFINENASADASRWGALMCLAVRKKKKKKDLSSVSHRYCGCQGYQTKEGIQKD